MALSKARVSSDTVRTSMRLTSQARLAFLAVPLLWTAVLASFPMPALADALEEARELFDAGVAASGDERWAEARDYFESSLALAEKAATLLNLAVAEVKLGRGRDALRTLDRFDRMADPAQHPAMIERSRVLRKLAAQAAVTEPEPPLPRAEASPTPSVTATSEVAPEPPRHQSANEPTTAPTPPLSSSLGGPRLLLSLGGALAAGAVGSGVWWRARTQAIDRCDARVPPCDNRSVVVRERNTARGITLAASGSALGLLVAGTLWLLRTKATPNAGAAQIGWSDDTLTVTTRF